MSGLQNRSASTTTHRRNATFPTIPQSIPPLTLQKGSNNSSHTPDTHTDRNAAITLSTLLFLILMAIAWYFRLHIKTHRGSDLERQQCQDEPMMRRRSLAKNTWYRRSSSNATAASRNANSIFETTPMVTRKDSVATASSSGHPTTPEKRKWPSLSHWRTQDSGVSTLAPPTPSSPSSPDLLPIPVSSIQSITLPLTSTERPSSRRSTISVASPISVNNPHYPTPPRRRSSLPSAYDRRWWSEVARRGSTSSTTRRLSILEPVFEPEVRGYEYESRMSISEKQRRESWEDTATSHRGGSQGEGEGAKLKEVDCDGSWRGSKCESVMYDWTRPSDVEMQRASEIRYTKIDWKKERGRAKRASVPTRVVGRRVEDDECIQEMDFALMR